MISVKKAPYTGPYASDATKLPHQGPTVEAIKRALARMGLMAWKDDFTDRWPADGELDRAFRKWERDLELPGNGVYGEQEWKALRYEKVPAGRPHAGEYALDNYACVLIQKDWDSQNVPDEADFRAALTQFCLTAEKYEDRWHYAQYRPVDVTVEPSAGGRYDCSSYVVVSYHWAMVKSSLVVPDPSKQSWSGYGNTDFYLDDHPHVSAPFKVGDLAHYSGHVTLCRKGGTATTAIFSSHGTEAGPMPTSLHYRSDLRFVVRPPLKEA